MPTPFPYIFINCSAITLNKHKMTFPKAHIPLLECQNILHCSNIRIKTFINVLLMEGRKWIFNITHPDKSGTTKENVNTPADSANCRVAGLPWIQIWKKWTCSRICLTPFPHHQALLPGMELEYLFMCSSKWTIQRCSNHQPRYGQTGHQPN